MALANQQTQAYREYLDSSFDVSAKSAEFHLTKVEEHTDKLAQLRLKDEQKASSLVSNLKNSLNSGGWGQQIGEMALSTLGLPSVATEFSPLNLLGPAINISSACSDDLKGIAQDIRYRRFPTTSVINLANNLGNISERWPDYLGIAQAVWVNNPAVYGFTVLSNLVNEANNPNQDQSNIRQKIQFLGRHPNIRGGLNAFTQSLEIHEQSQNQARKAEVTAESHKHKDAVENLKGTLDAQSKALKFALECLEIDKKFRTTLYRKRGA